MLPLQVKFSECQEKSIDLDVQHRYLQEAILKTVAPDKSNPISQALLNMKSTRKRVQAKHGEILTEEEVIKRLKKEQDDRNSKKLEKPKVIKKSGFKKRCKSTYR